MPAIGHSFHVLQSVESTNNYAMAQVHAGLAMHGNAYFSMNQTSGKGQRGKAWQSTEGENIALSLVIQPDPLLISQQFLLSVAVALACYKLVNAYAASHVSLKWPNDIYWRDRKAGGILIENVVQGTGWQYAVAGIGLNINQTVFPNYLPNAVSLRQITGRFHDPELLARELCTYIEAEFCRLNKAQELLDEYNNVLYRRNERVRLKRNNVVFQTLIKAVSLHGRLITEGPVEQEFDVGEVEWL